MTEAEIQALGKLGSELELLLSAIVLDDFDYRSFGKSVDSVGERQKQEGSDRATVWIPGWKIEHDGSTISPFEWKVYLPIDFKTAKPVWCKKDDSPKLSYPHETPGISSSGAYHLSRYALISKIILAYLHNIAGFESFVHKHSMGLVNYFPPERVLNWGNEIRDGAKVVGIDVDSRRVPFASILRQYDHAGKKKDYDVVRVDKFTLENGRARIGGSSPFGHNYLRKNLQLRSDQGLLELTVTLGGTGVLLATGHMASRDYWQPNTDAVPDVPMWYQQSHNFSSGWKSDIKIDPTKANASHLTKSELTINFKLN